MTNNVNNLKTEKFELHPKFQRSTHFLDRVGRIPFVGSLAGLARVISALFFGLVFQLTKIYAKRSHNQDLISKSQRNICRASGEFFRGLIELVPFAINAFERKYEEHSTVAMGPYLFDSQEFADLESPYKINYFFEKKSLDKALKTNLPNNMILIESNYQEEPEDPNYTL